MAKAIRINKAGQVDPRDRAIGVSKATKEDVLWIDMDDGGPFTIKFDYPAGGPPGKYPFRPGSPFGPPQFTIPKGKTGGSTGGPIVDEYRTYRYSVWKGGVRTDDPDVDIDP